MSTDDVIFQPQLELSLLDQSSKQSNQNPEVKQEKQPDVMTDACSSNRLWMITAMTFAAISLGLAVYVIYREVPTDDSVVMTEIKVIKKYPGYFRSPIEEHKIQEQVSSINATRVQVETNSTSPYSGCSYQCLRVARRRRDLWHAVVGLLGQPNEHSEHTKHSHQRQQSHVRDSRDVSERVVGLLNRPSQQGHVSANRHKRQSGDGNSFPLGPPVYHGCCISRSSVISPTQMFNIDNEERTLVQFETQKQYIFSYVCRHASGCRGCTCRQEVTTMSAVVENPDSSGEDDKYMLDLIVVPGCCKCYNS